MTMHGKQWAVAAFAVVGLVGCGGEGTYVYDVEFDAAKLADVTTHCEYITARPAGGAAMNLAPQQRWILRDDRYGATTLEVPDLDFSLPSGSYSHDADAEPDVLSGTSPEAGPLQYVGFDRVQDIEGFSRSDFQINIYEGAMEDQLKGFIWIRGEWYFDLPGVTEGKCTSYVPFTGRRVKE